MTRIISAFPLEANNNFLQINTGHRVLACQTAGRNLPYIVCEHDTDNPQAVYQVFALPTGCAAPEDAEYIGTFPLVTQETNHIQVVGSKGLQPQNQARLNIMHVFIRPARDEDIPAEMRSALKEPEA